MIEHIKHIILIQFETLAIETLLQLLELENIKNLLKDSSSRIIT